MSTTPRESRALVTAKDPNIRHALEHLQQLYNAKKNQEAWDYSITLLQQYPDNTEIIGFVILLSKYVEKLHITLGLALSHLHRHPHDFYITYQLGMYYYNNHQFMPALKLIKEALALDKNNFLLGSNLAVIYFEHGDFDLAIPTYQHQLDIKSTYESMGFGQALAWLAQGNYEKGWPAFEKRFLLKEPDCRPIKLPTPIWDGKTDIQGKRLLVTWEQGFGDNIQFIRFMPLLKQKTQANIIHICLEKVFRLFQSVPGIDYLIDKAPIPAHDYQLGIQSIPFLLGLNREEQLLPMPYLHADISLIDMWRPKINTNNLIKVGLCWSGGKAYMHGAKRNTGLHYFLNLFSDPRIQLYSLQTPISAEDADILLAGNIQNFNDDLTDFAETAAVISLLDIVITVDTAVAHLAAALGKPTLVLIRYETEWRHPRDRNISPWYASMQLFRQHKPGRWEDCVQDAIVALNQFIEDFKPIPTNITVANSIPAANRIDNPTLTPISIRFPKDKGKITEQDMLKLNQLYIDNKFEECLALSKEYFASDPSCLGALVSIARAAASLNQEYLALGILFRRLKDEPNNILTNYLLSLAYKMLRKYDRSFYYANICYQKEPNNTIYLESVAKNYYDLGDTKQGYEYYKKIYALQETAETNINISLCALANRQYEEGWERYESRFGLAIFAKEYTQSNMPFWDGKTNITGKRLALIWEQGIGDVIQFMRFIPLLKQKTQAHICFVCGTGLLNIAKKMSGVDMVWNQTPLPLHDYKLYLQSLPFLFHLNDEKQFSSEPYILPDVTNIEKWREKLKPYQGYKIGICWKGGTKYSYNKERNATLSYFLPLIEHSYYQLINLQKDLTTEEKRLLSLTPIIDFTSQLVDFEETAALMYNLDLIITVDTSVAHLAGAMGKPVWTLIRHETEWRHPRDTDISPWYPSMRLFRQTKAGDWDSLFEQVQTSLTEFFPEPKKENP